MCIYRCFSLCSHIYPWAPIQQLVACPTRSYHPSILSLSSAYPRSVRGINSSRGETETDSDSPQLHCSALYWICSSSSVFCICPRASFQLELQGKKLQRKVTSFFQSLPRSHDHRGGLEQRWNGKSKAFPSSSAPSLPQWTGAAPSFQLTKPQCIYPSLKPFEIELLSLSEVSDKCYLWNLLIQTVCVCHYCGQTSPSLLHLSKAHYSKRPGIWAS